MKKFFVFTTILFFLLLCGCVGFGYWYHENFMKDLEDNYEELNSYYEGEYNSLLSRFNELQTEKTAVEKELADLKEDYGVLSDNLRKSEETIKEYNDAVTAKNKAEEDRIKALSEEELTAENFIRDYSGIVKALKESNEEYARLYVEMTGYLAKEEITAEERAELITKYERMLEIQEEYKKSLAGEGTGDEASGEGSKDAEGEDGKGKDNEKPKE